MRFLSAQRLEFCLALSGLLCRGEFGRSRVLPGALQCVLGLGQLRFERIPRGRDFRDRCAKFHFAEPEALGAGVGVCRRGLLGLFERRRRVTQLLRQRVARPFALLERVLRPSAGSRERAARSQIRVSLLGFHACGAFHVRVVLPCFFERTVPAAS